MEGGNGKGGRRGRAHRSPSPAAGGSGGTRFGPRLVARDSPDLPVGEGSTRHLSEHAGYFRKGAEGIAKSTRKKPESAPRRPLLRARLRLRLSRRALPSLRELCRACATPPAAAPAPAPALRARWCMRRGALPVSGATGTEAHFPSAPAADWRPGLGAVRHAAGTARSPQGPAGGGRGRQGPSGKRQRAAGGGRERAGPHVECLIRTL